MAVSEFFDAETVWTSDIDDGAGKIIAHRYPEAPNLGDITQIDWAEVEPVDIITGGWPCQPFSVAGKRLGAEDARALWPEVERAVRALRPRYVVLENVSAIASAGELSRAVTSLASLGYVGAWRCLRASDVGAPHIRSRIFIVAADTKRVLPWRSAASGHSENGRPYGELGGCSRASVADTDCSGRGGWPRSFGQGGRCESPDGRQIAADSDCERLQGSEPAWRRHLSSGCVGAKAEEALTCSDAFGEYSFAVRRWELILGRPAPSPTERSPKGNPRLSPMFTEWMMGLPPGWVTGVPGLGYRQQGKALGNGVVPQQAFAALNSVVIPE